MNQAKQNKQSVGQKKRRRQRRARERVVSEVVGGKTPQKRKGRKFGRPTVFTDDLVARASGANGTDIRSPHREVKVVGNSSIANPQQDPVMNVGIRITQRSLAYLAMGIVLRAIQRGWLGSLSGKTSTPYYAFRYLIDTFKNSVSATFPTLMSAPMWFWEINAALLPKTERFKTGRVAYKGFNLDDGQGVDVNFVLGTSEYSYSVFWGIPDPGSLPVNGYTVLQAPPPYTIEAGMESVQALFEFFDEAGESKRVESPGENGCWMSHDTSAFAAVYAEMGASYFSPGGTAVTAQSERRINSPIFAKFAPYQDADFNWRGFHEYHRTAGSPCYIGPRLSELFRVKDIRNKVTPIFKWFWFDEFFNVLSLTMCLALEALGRAGQPTRGCPLTSQQVQIMLRQTILPFFDNDMAQDLRLVADAWTPFLPFVVGPNGVSQASIGSGMQLPMFLAENIRCCKRITASLRNAVRRVPGGKTQEINRENMVVDIVPILGRPSPSVIPQLGNYTWLAGGVTHLLYADEPTEIPINLIDASAPVGGSTAYLDLNGKAQPTLVQNWNVWVTELSGCLVGLTQISADRGCEALSTLVYTNQQRLVAPTPEPPSPVTTTGKAVAKQPESSSANSKAARRASKTYVGLSIEKLRTKVTIGPSPGPSELFLHVALGGTSATMGFTSELWKYLSTWVLPISLTTTNGEESSLQAYQTNVVEPFYQVSTSTYSQFGLNDSQNDFPIMWDKHTEFASHNIKAWNSPTPSEMETEFKELSAEHEGGFFTKIAGMIGEGLGIKGSREFADSIGNLTGL